MSTDLKSTRESMRRHATISDCGKFRYRLWRKWGSGSPLLFVMLNPSTADGEQDDATIRRCLRFAMAHDFGELEVVNLYAYRCTDPQGAAPDRLSSGAGERPAHRRCRA
jgi:hypothetical protein